MNFKQDSFGYFLLASVLLTASYLFRTVAGNNIGEWAVILTVICFYITWGLWTHKKQKRLEVRIVREYFLLGLLAASIFYLINVL